jgi:hypothetical protein
VGGLGGKSLTASNLGRSGKKFMDLKSDESENNAFQ